MDSLDKDLNSLLDYYVKRDDVLFAPATKNDNTSAAISKTRINKNSTKQFPERLKRRFSKSSKSTAAPQQQQHESILISTAPQHFHSIRTQLNSASLARNMSDQILPCNKSKMRIFGTKTKKHIPHHPKSPLMKKQRQSRDKGDFIGTAVETSVGSMDMESGVTLNDCLMVNDQSGPITNVDTKKKKHAPRLLKSLLTKCPKNRRKDVYHWVDMETTGRYFDFKGVLFSEDSSSELSCVVDLEPITNKNEKKQRQDRQMKGFIALAAGQSDIDDDDDENKWVTYVDDDVNSLVEDLESITNIKSSVPVSNTATRKPIPHFLKSIFISKSQTTKQSDVFNRTSAVTSGFVANLKGGALSANNYNSKVQVEKSLVKDCTAINTSIDLSGTGRPITVVPELKIDKFEKVPKCDCEMRRINLMADILNLICLKNKNKDLRNQKIRELQQIDPVTLHFKTCPETALALTQPAANMDRGRSQSQTSLYSIHSCLMCQEPDEQLEEDVVGTLMPLMAQLENEDELNIPLKTIEYFLHASCYDHFKEGLIKVIGSECTPKKVARFHYLIRRVVQHIGDPTDESDKTIENILNHSKKFNLHFYQPHIKSMYHSMTNFLLSGLENDDVD